MKQVKIECLGESATQDHGAIGHIRIWLPNSADRNSVVASIVESMALSHEISLEIWDARHPTMSKVQKLRLPMEVHAEVGHPLIQRVPIRELKPIFEELSSESFGAWLNMTVDAVRAVARHDKDVDRVRSMPPEARFFVFSLYDDNIEIFAHGTSDSDLESQVRSVLTATK